MDSLTSVTTANAPVAEDIDLMNSPERFINREFSWLQFNRRVLEETLNTAHPLLERVRFLSISAANLDEFFMVRVAGLEGQVRQGVVVRSPDGKTPVEQLQDILKEIDNLQMEQQASLAVLQQYLAKEDILIVRPISLSAQDRGWLATEFDQAIFPVLTPLSIDPAHPFPFIPNLGFTMGLQLVSTPRPRADDGAFAPARGARPVHPSARCKIGDPLYHAGGCRQPVHRTAVSGL